MPPDQTPGAESSPITLYVHIPFCCRRCAYCGTFRTAGGEPEFDPFVQAVSREWRLLCDEMPEAGACPVVAVYVGGGMPSLFGTRRLGELLARLRETSVWAPGCEVTLEAYPGSLDRESVEALRDAGFNRLHIRAQSFWDPDLEVLDRGYSADQARAAVEEALRAIGNVSLDLRYGVAGQTLDHWTTTLKAAAALECAHIVCNQVGRREETLPERLLRGNFHESHLDEHLLGQYQAAARRLGEAGYEHYEVESFAQPSKASRYMLSLLGRGIGYGLGPGAHSFDGAVRWRNAPDLGAYLSRLMEAVERHVAAAAVARLEHKARVLATQGFLEMTTGGVRLDPQAYFVVDSVVLELVRSLEDKAA